MEKKLPDFKYENICWKNGFDVVAGVDEVGRGCFAGPIVAGCTVFNKQMSEYANVVRQADKQIKINDSKKLTRKQREVADKWIRKNALAVGIGQASVAQINKLGIKKASESAFRRAIHSISQYHDIDFLLIDAFYVPYVKGLRRKNQKAIIKGDTKSISIASASIIAKVYRDKLMVSLGKKYKFRKYKWNKNKGYGTKVHRDAIKKYGITRQHRKAFINTWLSKSEVRNTKS